MLRVRRYFVVSLPCLVGALRLGEAPYWLIMARSNQDQRYPGDQTPISSAGKGTADSSSYGNVDFNSIISAPETESSATETGESPSDTDRDSVFDVSAEAAEMAIAGRGHDGIWHRFTRYWSRHSLRYFAGLICAVLCLLVLLLPSPYVIETPGPTQDVLGKADGKEVVAITGATTHKSQGKLLLLTVNAQGVPGSPTPGIQTLIAWLDPHQQVMPSEAVFPVGQSSEDYKKTSVKEMTGSQDSATAAALAFAQKHKIAGAKTAKIEMHVDDIGGPSAGMMYALGVINKLTPQDETGGKTIAGTGTIDKKGQVGKIGGIQLKMLGAKRDGATYFLAPAANCNEVVGHVPKGLRDVKVSTLEEAYRSLVAIGQNKASDLPHCTA